MSSTGDAGTRKSAKTPSSEGTTTSLQAAGGKGLTTIDGAVVAKIVSIAAREVEGVAQLGGAVSGAIANVVSRIRGDEHSTGGVGVEVGEKQAAADLTMVVEYPANIPDVTQSVRDNVISRVEELTGLEVVEVNIAVTDLRFSGEDDDEGDGVSRSRVE